MQLKEFFTKKHVIFYLSILTFILLMVATLAVGLKNILSSEVVTLQSIFDLITSLRSVNETVPTHLIVSSSLMVSGLIISGVAMLFLFFNLFKFEKLNKYHDAMWWLGLSFNLIALILILAGEGHYVNEETKLIKPLKFEDLFELNRFIGLVLMITVFPLTTFIWGAVWYPNLNKVPVKKTK